MRVSNMTDTEKIIEEIIREAAGNIGSSIAWKPDEGETNEQWEEIKKSLKIYGTVTQFYDGEDSIKFTVSEQGRAFLTMGGFNTIHLNRRVAEAAISAADSAKKSATYAKLAGWVALAMLVLSIISWLTTCRQSANRQQAHTSQLYRTSDLQSYLTDLRIDADSLASNYLRRGPAKRPFYCSHESNRESHCYAV